MEKQDYRLITKKSAIELRQEGINGGYFQIGKSTSSRNRIKLFVRGITYTEAFDKLMKRLEEYQSVKFGICNIIELKEKTIEIILRGDLVIST